MPLAGNRRVTKVLARSDPIDNSYLDTNKNLSRDFGHKQKTSREIVVERPYQFFARCLAYLVFLLFSCLFLCWHLVPS